MSAYTAAYQPPPSGSCGGKGTSAPFGGLGAKGVPASYEPLGASGAEGGVAAAAGAKGVAGGSTAKATGKGTSDAQWRGGKPSFSGLGTATSEPLVASVPVRPYTFTLPAQQVTLEGRGALVEKRGTLARPYATMEKLADFSILEGVLTDNEVAEIVATGSKVLSDLIASGRAREQDPTDGRPSFAVDLAPQGAYSGDLAHVFVPLVERALLPFIRLRYGCLKACLSAARFRRYMSEERPYAPPHHEHGALVVATVGLQDTQAFTGGLFVQGSGRAFLDRKFIPLGRGDVCIFQHDLHHGVEVQEGSRLELSFIFKDCSKAVEEGTSPWYADAAEAGDASAQYGWALSLLGQEHFSSAQDWLDKACEQDHPEALYTRAELSWAPPAGSGIEKHTGHAMQLYRRAAELGHAKSQSRLGDMLVRGVTGRVQQDAWEGKRILRLAFEQDDPDAAYHLGRTLLQEGDRDGATKLLAACAKGQPQACFQAAEMYRDGHYSIPRDALKSLRYTKWAAHQGDAQALSNLGHLLINGLGVVRDDAKAVRLFRQAAKLGAAEGQLNYGLALLRGSGGVNVDYREALQWAQKAAAQGHALAQQQLMTFFNAAKNPNPPARSRPTSLEELNRLGIRELRELLRAEGVDFSDCVEKSDLVARAVQQLMSVAEPWDAAPEHTILLEAPRKTRDEFLKQHRQQQEERDHRDQEQRKQMQVESCSNVSPTCADNASTNVPAGFPSAAAAAACSAHGDAIGQERPARVTTPAPAATPSTGAPATASGGGTGDVARPQSTASPVLASDSGANRASPQAPTTPAQRPLANVVDDAHFELVD